MINWKWFIVEGIVLIALGFFAIVRPGIAAEAIVELIGWLLLFVGGIALFGGVTSQSGPRKPVSLGGGLVALIFGMIFLLLPSPALATITVILAIFFCFPVLQKFQLRCHFAPWADIPTIGAWHFLVACLELCSE